MYIGRHSTYDADAQVHPWSTARPMKSRPGSKTPAKREGDPCLPTGFAHRRATLIYRSKLGA
jgi:hypothetical protein